MNNKKNKKRVTLNDVAKEAQVGIATVDRVINERGNVSDEVRQKVLLAAQTLGLKRILPSPHHRIIRVNVILARPERPLIRRMATEFRRQAQRLDRTMTLHRTVLKYESPEAIAEAMLRKEFDAVIVDAPNDPIIHEAIEEMTRQGRPVVTMISDVPGTSRLAYAGTDHYKAGRSAGYFLGLMTTPLRPGKVVVLCHQIGFQGHTERIRGLTDYLAENVPHLTLAEVVRGGDDPLLSEVLLKETFRRHPETRGIYNVGAGNRGVIGAIKAELLPTRPLFIGHELTNYTYQCLKEGTMTLTIDQSPELQAQFALEVLLKHFGLEEQSGDDAAHNLNVPFVLYGPQNLPNEAPE